MLFGLLFEESQGSQNTQTNKQCEKHLYTRKKIILRLTFKLLVRVVQKVDNAIHHYVVDKCCYHDRRVYAYVQYRQP